MLSRALSFSDIHHGAFVLFFSLVTLRFDMLISSLPRASCLFPDTIDVPVFGSWGAGCSGVGFSDQDDAAVTHVRNQYEHLEALLRQIQAAESRGEALCRSGGG